MCSASVFMYVFMDIYLFFLPCLPRAPDTFFSMVSINLCVNKSMCLENKRPDLHFSYSLSLGFIFLKGKKTGYLELQTLTYCNSKFNNGEIYFRNQIIVTF